MKTEGYILVKKYCEHSNMEDGFIVELHEYGLIECKEIDRQKYLATEEITEIERLSRLYYDLGINLEGIDALNNVLQKVREMDKELRQLRNRLRLYE